MVFTRVETTLQFTLEQAWVLSGCCCKRHCTWCSSGQVSAKAAGFSSWFSVTGDSWLSNWVWKKRDKMYTEFLNKSCHGGLCTIYVIEWIDRFVYTCSASSDYYRMGRRISAIWLVNYCVRIFSTDFARDITIAIAIAKTISTILHLFTPARKCEPLVSALYLINL